MSTSFEDYSASQEFKCFSSLSTFFGDSFSLSSEVIAAPAFVFLQKDKHAVMRITARRKAMITMRITVVGS